MMEQGMPPYMPTEESRAMEPPKSVPMPLPPQMSSSMGVSAMSDMNMQQQPSQQPPPVSEASVSKEFPNQQPPQSQQPQPIPPQQQQQHPPPSPQQHLSQLQQSPSMPATPPQKFASPPHNSMPQTSLPTEMPPDMSKNISPQTQSSSNSTLDPVTGNMVPAPPSNYNNLPYNSKMDDMMSVAQPEHPMMQGPPHPPPVFPGPGPDMGRGGMYQSPISHQQEMAALNQQLQESYCMPPTPDVQMRVSSYISIFRT